MPWRMRTQGKQGTASPPHAKRRVMADLGLNMLVLIRPVTPLHVLKDVRFPPHPEFRRVNA
jgi:hypothetical protein